MAHGGGDLSRKRKGSVKTEIKIEIRLFGREGPEIKV